MACSRELFISLGIASALIVTATAQTSVEGESFVARGCVSRAVDLHGTARQPLLLWSRGEIYLIFPDPRFKPAQPNAPVGTAGTIVPVFFLIDDEDDFTRYLEQHVQITGELRDDASEGTIRIDDKGDFIETEFETDGHEARVRIKRSWLASAIGSEDAKVDVAARTVHTKRVTVLGSCWSPLYEDGL
ncbi:MAG: hypothetical protein ACRD3C_18315 [Vicinamibacterales bacterium]